MDKKCLQVIISAVFNGVVKYRTDTGFGGNSKGNKINLKGYQKTMTTVTHANFTAVQHNVENQQKPLNECVRDAMERYFAQLGGENPINLYDMVLEEIESPLLEAVMVHTKGNQSKTARILGLSRGTLRTKLRKYFDSRKPGKHSQEME